VRASVVGLLGTRHDLDDAAGIAQVNEHHSAMVTPPRRPSRENYPLPRVLGTQRPGLMRPDHVVDLSRQFSSKLDRLPLVDARAVLVQGWRGNAAADRRTPRRETQ